jgi:lipopolysaccharide biosynthesis glycosyltransferase
MTSAFVYVTDKNGYELLQHSAMSLVLSQPTACSIHVYCYKFMPDPSDKFGATLTAFGANVTFRQINNPEIEAHSTFGHVTTPTLLKLSAVTELIEHYDRVIYLDNDVLVFGDLKIGSIVFGNSPVAAVIDMDLSETGALRNTKWSDAAAESFDVGDYFNAGFMIFASENWRGASFPADYSKALSQHDIACLYKVDCTSIDQCALNYTFRKAWLKLPVTYNMQAGAKFTGAWKDAAVRHYCGRRKFLPITAFRNDRRDVRYLSNIRRNLGRPAAPWALWYEIPFRLNVLRKYRSAASMRRFLNALQSSSATSSR